MTAMKPRSQTEIAQAFFADVSSGEFSAIDRYMLPNVEYTVIAAQSLELFQVLPWVGRRYGRQAVKDYLVRLNQNQGLVRFDIETVIEQHQTVALFGTLQTSALSTRNGGTWEFAIKLEFQNGQIARYHLYEDSYTAAAMHRRSGYWIVENAENLGQTKRVP